MGLDRGVPEYFSKICIPQLNLLFIGYELDECQFKIIWEGLLSQAKIDRKVYFLTTNPQKRLKRFWTSRNVIILNIDLTEFAKMLVEKFKLEIPQLIIEIDSSRNN